MTKNQTLAGNDVFDWCYSALEKGTYKAVGMVLAYSLIHGGPAPNFFSKQLYRMVSGQAAYGDCSVSDVSDMSVRQQLQQVIF